MQFGAVGFQPDACSFHSGDGIAHQSPEPRTMIHFKKMSDLMRRHIVQNKWRRKDEPPRERKSTSCRAGAPARCLIADRNPLEAALKRLGVLFCARRDVLANFGPQPVMEAARRMLIVAAHVKTRDRSIETLAAQMTPIGRRCLGDGGDCGISFLPDDSAVALWTRKFDAMKFAPERDNGAIDEGRSSCFLSQSA